VYHGFFAVSGETRSSLISLRCIDIVFALSLAAPV
jgi:hypothetical protein